MKTPLQLASDKRQKALLLPTKRAKPRNVQQIVIAPRRTQLLPHWSSNDAR